MVNIEPNKIVKTCKYIESGVRFCAEGVRCCCANTWESPIIISAEEMENGSLTYDLVVERRKELFYGLNDLNNKNPGSCKKCGLVYETEFKNINFDYLGGHGGCSGFNIQHYSMCNLRCTYCWFTQNNKFIPPTYNNIIEFIELFNVREKIIGGNWIEYNGGEPTLLNNFEDILNYLLNNNFGDVCIFSNAVLYKQAIFDGLKNNKIALTTSLDSGTRETFKALRGVDCFDKVVDNLRKYKESNPARLWIKYIICEENRSEEDLQGFINLMEEIKPNLVYICPNFPYLDADIPYSTVEFGARLYLELEKKGLSIYIQSDDMRADPKFAKYSKDIREKIEELKNVK